MKSTGDNVYHIKLHKRVVKFIESRNPKEKLKIKESFGEDEKGSYFKILLGEVVVIDERGKLIKTLRKRAYKALFYFLLE